MLYANNNVGKIPVGNNLQWLIDARICVPGGAGQSFIQLSDGWDIFPGINMLQQQTLALRAWAPHPNVHLAQMKMGKSISKGRANISWATPQITSGWIVAVQAVLPHRTCALGASYFQKVQLANSVKQWWIKEICSLKKCPLWSRHRRWFILSLSTRDCGISVFTLRVCGASSNVHFHFKGALEQTETNTCTNLQQMKLQLRGFCATYKGPLYMGISGRVVEPSPSCICLWSSFL